MKLSKLYLLAALIACVLGIQSCFKDMGNNPRFNYPPKYIPEYNPLKAFLTFENEAKDEGGYRFVNIPEKATFIDEGVSGKAYQGGEKSYIVITPSAGIMDSIVKLGSFSIAFWINAEQVTAATCLFSIAHKSEAQGNFDIFMEHNRSHPTQAYFKGYLRTISSGSPKGQWIDVGSSTPEGSSRVDDVLGKWTHIAFRYNGDNSTFYILRNGDVVLTKVFDGFGKLEFDPKSISSFSLGAFGGQAGISSKTISWAGSCFKGKIDQFRFYNQPISDAEIKKLYESKQ